ncbi:MFS transporter [Morganella psychrotolerans]|uniref:MFS transporter n=1 Tax=Morganella psychrotolerans TaxID=368603 RepID=UPI0039B10DD4
MISPYLLPVLAMIVFFTGVTEFMVSPMLTPLAEAFSVTPAQSSWLIAVYTLSYAIAAPFMGRVSDRVNRYKLLRAALLLFAADGFALALAPGFAAAAGLRVLGGLASAALIPTVFALIAEQFPPAQRATIIGYVMTGMTLGIVSGPLMAGWLTARTGWYMPFVLTATGGLIMWVICGFLFRNISTVPLPVSHKTGKIRDNPRLIGFLMAKGLWNGAAVTLFVLSGELLRLRFGLPTETVGLIGGVFGGGLFLGNILLPFIMRRYRTESRLLLISLAGMTLMVAAFISGTGGLYGSLLWMMLWGAMLGIAAPVSTSVVAERAGTYKGEALALSESMNNVSIFILLPFTAGLLASQGSTALLIAAVILLCGATGLTGYLIRPENSKK